MEFSHQPVLFNEAIESLCIKPDGIYVDATMGGAGHSKEIAKRLTTGKIIAIDQDADAIEAGRKNLEAYADKVTIVHDNFRNLREILNNLSIKAVDGILLDLGVSSYQLDTAHRGFSYNFDAPLDMRMDDKATLTAYKIVNEYSETDIEKIISDYGEERFARRIAYAICQKRQEKKIKTTLELVEIIKQAIPAATRREGPHPAKRTFQAIRIAVNDELGALESLLANCPDLLKTNGVIAVITFHSLEDRIVKQAFSKLSMGCTCPKNFPVCVCNKKPILQLISKKYINPSEQEVTINPRARSARLRVACKL